MAQRTQAEFQAMLSDIADHIRSDAEGYDAGRISGIRPLANNLGALLLDRGRSSVSLLTHLGRKDQTRFLSTPVHPSGLSVHIPALCRVVPVARYIIKNPEQNTAHVALVPHYSGSPSFLEMPVDFPPMYQNWEKRPFADWWHQKVLAAGDDIELSRGDCIQLVRDKEAAHIDGNVSASDLNVLRQRWKVEFAPGPMTATTEASTLAATVRQIVYEVQRTIDDQLSDLTTRRAYAPPPPRERLDQPGGKIWATQTAEYLRGVLADLVNLNKWEDRRMIDELERKLHWMDKPRRAQS